LKKVSLLLDTLYAERSRSNVSPPDAPARFHPASPSTIDLSWPQHNLGRSGPVMVILEGRIKITKVHVDGREVILELRGAGDILSELTCIDGHPRSATAQFLTHASTLHLSDKEFVEMIETEPAIGAATLS